MSRADEAPLKLTCELCPPDSGHGEFSRPWSEAEYVQHLKLVHECDFCGMLCETDSKKDSHLYRIHGKEYRLEEWFKIVGDEAIPQFGRFVDVGDWRNPVETIQGIPMEPCALSRWIYPMCLRMLQFKHAEAALFAPPRELSSQALYSEVHFNAVKACYATERFRRLKGSEAKARCVAKALALPDCAPGYAEQQLKGCRVG